MLDKRETCKVCEENYAIKGKTVCDRCIQMIMMSGNVRDKVINYAVKLYMSEKKKRKRREEHEAGML